MSRPPNPPSSSPIVLVVEDDLDLLQAIGFSFETEGFTVRAFETGEALLREPVLPAHGCLVLDQSLPGVGGLDVLKELRERGVVLPAVLITTATPAIEDRARLAGAVLVQKPLMASSLLDEVNRQLGRAA